MRRILPGKFPLDLEHASFFRRPMAVGGSHLNRASAELWSSRFLAAMTPTLDECLVARGR
jgi:hypothetical protein